LWDEDTKDNAMLRLAAYWLLLEIHLVHNTDNNRNPDSYHSCSKP